MAIYTHKPVLMAAVMEGLHLRPGMVCLDGTVGFGGHAEAMLKATSPGGRVLCCDRDGNAVAAARERLAAYPGRFEIRQGNYADIGGWIAPESCEAALLDLGVSSYQLDDPSRGFSLTHDGPLDMRMNPDEGVTAADLVNELPVEELARIFWEHGGETESRRLARAIVMDRAKTPFRTTRQLAGLMERILPRGGRKSHPATRAFQALRIAVNREDEFLRSGLDAAMRVLKPGSRLVVLTFHSGEDRVVREYGRRLARDYEPAATGLDVPELRRPRPPLLKIVNRKAARAGAEEVEDNPRSRSAQCRVFEKI